MTTNQLPPISLEPLIADGRDCLRCRDIDGLDQVTLRGVEFYYHGKPWQQIIRRSDDVFELVENGIFKWPATDRLARAEFEVRLRNSKKTAARHHWTAWPRGRLPR